MLLDRRSFATGSAALLSGCATVGTRRLAGCTPLAPVIADESRIIRTMAGLRPYRRKGFVVRADQLGEKRLVHNYGHGGAGITLSWGTSKLATELGLQGHSGPVAVLGSGVVGLSTARLVQEAGFPVTIYTAALPPDTTSNIAGGQFHPFAAFHRGERHVRVHGAVHPGARLQLAPLPDHGRRRLRHPLAADLRRDRQPGSEGHRHLPAGRPDAEQRREPVPGGRACFATIRCTSRRAATSGR